MHPHLRLTHVRIQAYRLSWFPADMGLLLFAGFTQGKRGGDSVAGQLLTTVEVADMFKVSPMTIRRWCASGRLPALKLGREWRISKEKLDRLIEVQTDTELVQRDPSALGDRERGH